MRASSSSSVRRVTHGCARSRETAVSSVRMAAYVVRRCSVGITVVHHENFTLQPGLES
jgi:hypothetical protein